MKLARRQFLSIAALGAGAMWVNAHMALASVETDRRFVFIIQRGAADGLDIVRPYGDPAYAGLRGALVGDAAQSIKLDGTFALHPALGELGKMYAQGEALFVHAVASPYRDRSHFDGQNVLETGGVQPYQVKDGWLNRLVALMPHDKDTAIALAPTIPLALRGANPVVSYAPSSLPDAADDLMTRVGMLYDQDPQLHPLWAEAVQAKGLADGTHARQDPAGLGKLAATFLSRDSGPRIAMIETEGWDTHFAQAARLAAQLKALDMMIAALRDGLGPVWKDTTVLVATEFGRTAAVNGTGGTDHGTASMAMLVGGAVKGGRVLADWPGLAPSALYEERDLKPTMALDSLIAGAAAEALGLDRDRLEHGLFGPGTNGKSVEGLIRT
ncbi:MAG TPA: DUF1501 domain-containing protein [Devosia sp.]|nr:DUF1501 domain-containing protein [Devosia sp.]